MHPPLLVAAGRMALLRLTGTQRQAHPHSCTAVSILKLERLEQTASSTGTSFMVLRSKRLLFWGSASERTACASVADNAAGCNCASH